MKSTFVRKGRRKSSSRAPVFFPEAGPRADSFFSQGALSVQRTCAECAHSEEKNIQRKETGGPAQITQPSVASYIGRLATSGESLPASLQSFFGKRMGGDFGSVRIHRDADASSSAQSLHAQAYTVGNHIVFNSGKFQPHTEEGRRLLSHELAHVLQQRGEPVSLRNIQCMPEEEMQGPQESDGAASPKSEAEEEKATEQAEKASKPIVLADFSTFGKPSTHTDFVSNVTFKGQTDATFDGGVGQTKNLKAVPAKDCEGCDAAECVHVTGSLVITYQVSTTVTLPDVPDGLTPCQEKRVRDAINNKIKPHEDQHVSAFGTYNGAVTLPINFNGCKADLAAHVQAMHDAHAIARENAARAKSAALDPFHVSVNLDCEDEPPKK